MEPEKTLWMKCENRKTVGYAKCGPTPPGEIVVRSAFCNLECIPCFAYSYSWRENASKNKDVARFSSRRIVNEIHDFLEHNPPEGSNSYNWFRILGGEPFLSEAYLELYVDIISRIREEYLSLLNNKVLIQTNGLVLGKLSKESLTEKFEPLARTNSKIVVEVSVKGSNPLEFSTMTQSREEESKTLFQQHLKACQNLEYTHSKIPNIDWTAVAGFGIGVTNLKSQNLKNANYIKTFYNPESNKPFYHPDNWDIAFRDLFSSHVKKYGDRFGDKFPMFGIEDRPNWKSCFHGLKHCSELGRKYYYDRFITNKRNPNNMLEKYMEDIIEHFFYGDPSYYYVRLFGC
jgi:uncharacterized Fe-S cluster-containing radical SAM superfamily protein